MKKTTQLLMVWIAGVFGVLILIRTCASVGDLSSGPSRTDESVGAGSRASSAAGDSFIIPYSSESGVLITSVEQNEVGVTIYYWRINASGYVDHVYVSSRVLPADPTPTILTTSPADRQAVIADWQQRGYTARITMKDGQVGEYSNIFLHYSPPAGYVYTIYGHLIETSLEMQSGWSQRTVDFSEIQTLTRSASGLTVILRNGKQLAGPYIPPTFETHPYIPYIYAVQYAADGTISSSSFPFANVSSMEFLSWAKKGAK